MKLPHTIKLKPAGVTMTYNKRLHLEETGDWVFAETRVTLGENDVIAIKYDHDSGDTLMDWVTEDTYFETTQTLANSGGNWLVLDSAVSHPNVKIIIKEQELWNDCFGI